MGMRKWIQIGFLVSGIWAVNAFAQSGHAIQVTVDGTTYSCGQGADSDCVVQAKADQYKFDLCLPSYGYSVCFNNYFASKPKTTCAEWIKACYDACAPSFGQAHCSDYCSN
jgi:hypothetical protein